MQIILKLQNENFPYQRPIVNNLENTNKKSNIYMLILTLFKKKNWVRTTDTRIYLYITSFIYSN